jgi:hypothetical protein
MVIDDLPQPYISNNLLYGEFGIRLIGNTGDDKSATAWMRLYTRMHTYGGFASMLKRRTLHIW